MPPERRMPGTPPNWFENLFGDALKETQAQQTLVNGFWLARGLTKEEYPIAIPYKSEIEARREAMTMNEHGARLTVIRCTWGEPVALGNE